MDYFDNIWRSFRISWRHKYLWLIALFSGEGGGGFRFQYTSSNQQTSAQDFTRFQDQVMRFISDHAGLILALAVLWLVLVVALFILGAVCQGATVRAVAEHDAERPWGLGMAWRAGVHTMWAIVRFRLLILVLVLPVFAVVIGVVVAAVLAFASNNVGLGAGLVVLGLLLVLPVIAYLIYLFFLDRFGSRALVLEQLQARASIVRAHRLLLKRFGRSLLVGLLGFVVSLVLAILVACVSVIVAIPLIIAAVVAATANTGALVALIVIAVIVLLPIYLVVAGFLAAQESTYWTLAFRRMDIDLAPVASRSYWPPGAPPAAPPA